MLEVGAEKTASDLSVRSGSLSLPYNEKKVTETPNKVSNRKFRKGRWLRFTGLLSVMRAEDKLRATWSKREQAVMLHYPLGQSTKSDGHWLAGVFDKEFMEELERRGYDVSTLRFSVEPKAGCERFASQRVDG